MKEAIEKINLAYEAFLTEAYHQLKCEDEISSLRVLKLTLILIKLLKEFMKISVNNVRK